MPFLLHHSVPPCQEVSSATQTLPSKGEAVFRLHALINLRGDHCSRSERPPCRPQPILGDPVLNGPRGQPQVG